MAELFVLFSQIEAAKSAANKSRNELSQIRSQFDATARSLDWDIKCEQQVDRKLRAISDKLQSYENAIRAQVNFLEYAQSTYAKLEKRNEESIGAFRDDLYGDTSGGGLSSSALWELTFRDMLGPVFMLLFPQLQLFGLVPVITKLSPEIVRSFTDITKWLAKDAKAGLEWEKFGEGGYQNGTDYYFTNKDDKDVFYKSWGEVEKPKEKSFLDKLKNPEIALYKKEFWHNSGSLAQIGGTGGLLAAGYWNSKGELKVTSKGAEFETKANFSGVHGEKAFGGGNLSGKVEGDILSVDAKLKGGVDWSEGSASVEAGVMASVASVKGEAELDFWLFKVNLGGEASILSAGAAVKGEADLKNGKLGFSIGAGAGLAGGKVDVGIDFEYERIIDMWRGFLSLW